MPESPAVPYAANPQEPTPPKPEGARRPDGVALLAIWYAVLAGGAAFGASIVTIPIGFLSLAEGIRPSR